MKFTVAQRELNQALTILKSAISSKTTLEILKGIYLSASDSTLTLKSYNLDFSITMDLEVVVVEEGDVVLDYRLLNDIVRRLPDDMISFSLERQKMIVTAHKSRYEIIIFDRSEYPMIPEVEEDDGVVINQAIFKDMITKTNFAVSKDESNLVLTGALLEVSKNQMKMICIDGFAVAIKSVPIDTKQDKKVIIPGKMLGDLEKIIGQDVSSEMNIVIKDQYIAFFFDNIKVVSKILQGKYVDYQNILSTSFPLEFEFDKREFQQAVERSSLLAMYSRSFLIKLDFHHGQLEITSNSTMGESREVIETNNSDVSIKLGLNPNKLLAALRVIDAERIRFKMESPSRPCFIQPVEDESFLYYIVPIRIRDNNEA